MTIREQYESVADRSNERTAINTLIDVLNRANRATYEPIKLDKTHRLDYAILKFEDDADGTEIIFLETKKRSNQSDQYPDLMISKSKWDAGMAAHQAGFHFVILIDFTDGLYWYKHDPINEIEFKHSGRSTNTRDQWDIEDCAHIPMKYFTRLAGQ